MNVSNLSCPPFRILAVSAALIALVSIPFLPRAALAAVCAEGDACDDGDACTLNDICTAETCYGEPSVPYRLGVVAREGRAAIE